MDTDLIFWQSEQGWSCASFNGGAGGEFAAATQEQLGLLEMAAEAAEVSLDNAEYLWLTAEVEVKPILVPNKRQFKKNGLEVQIGLAWQMVGQVPNLDVPDTQALSTDKTTPVGLVDGSTIVWLNEGGQKAWLRARGERRRAEEEGRRAEQRRRARDAGDKFINPYTFVPLPAAIKRGMPRGHAAMDEQGLSGSFTWRLTFQTPLVCPRDALPAGTGGIVSYPGSSLRGVLRSIHETLVGGCFRAVDLEYCPVHREPMAAGTKKHTLAVVRKVDEMTGAVTEVEITEDLVWIEQSVVHKVIPASELCSGKLVDVDHEKAKGSKGTRRAEISQEGSVTPGTSWVLHLSDTFPARNKKRYHIAAGRLTGEKRQITAEQWRQFKTVCSGAKDLIGVTDPPNTSGTGPDDPAWPGIDVVHSVGKVGRRRKVDGWLAVGDTVWIGSESRLKMAIIWRYPGEYPVKERIPKELEPCHDPENLCPSCAVFGSVDQRVDADGKSTATEQFGYASHIRVGWAKSSIAPVMSEVDLPPLRNPKPSAGGFYLVSDPKADYKASKDENHKPWAHWGSAADATPRQIRGRKYYWHGQADNGRQLARDHHDDKQRYPVTLADKGLVLETKVTFDNLDREQLGWLLAAADPGQFFGTSCLVHVGGGKPLGYGSARPEIVGLDVRSAVGRYRDGDPRPEDVVELVSAVRSKTSADLAEVHAALKRVLEANSTYIVADRIWYPTTGDFNKREDMKKFDSSFEWFANHSGGRSGEGEQAAGDMVPLPNVMDHSPYLPSWVPADAKKRDRGGRQR